MLLSSATRSARRALAIAALFGAAVGACAACGEITTPADSGVDSGVDAGRDAGRIADAGRDAGERDANASIEVEPGWVRLEGFPPECPNERATNPAPLLDVRWEPCPFDAESCVYLPWDDRFYHRTIREGTSGHDGERGYFVVTQQRARGEDSMVIDAVADTEGRVYAAWRDDSVSGDGFACGGVTAVGSGRVAHLAQSRGPHPGTELLVGPIRLYWSDLETASDGEHLALVMDESIVPFGNAVYWAQTSATLVALRFDGTGQVLLFDGTSWVMRGGIPTGTGRAFAPVVNGSDVFWSANRERVMTASTTRDATTLYEDEVLQVGTGGPDLAWMRIVERNASGTIIGTELWTTPVATDPAAVRARQVGPRMMWALRGGIVGDGLYAYNSQDQSTAPYVSSIHVIDLADGSRRRYDLPTGDQRWNADWLEWVTRDEVAVAGAGRLADGTLVDGTLVRIQLSAFVPDP